MSEPTNLIVAQTILAQLGGRVFQKMTGAKNCIGSEDTLSFHLPRNFAQKGIQGVWIKLEASDTYTVEFIRVSGTQRIVVSRFEDVYHDQLQEIFTRETGLATKL